MAYQYANPQDVKNITHWCEEVIREVQNAVRSYFTFDIRLIGSGDKKLVTQNTADGNFDLDYNLILQRDKQGIINDPKRIKQLFIDKFNAVARQHGFEYANDSTSVITVRLVKDKRLKFSFDVAILAEGPSGAFHRLTHDKGTGRYIWNEVRHSKNYVDDFQWIKENKWKEFMNEYLRLKNHHLRQNDGVKSFSIFLEAINSFRR